MLLWLDDLRDPHKHPYYYSEKDCLWVKNVQDAIDALKTGNILCADLDHDLGDEDVFTGYNLVLWMEENNIWPINGVFVHSWNPVGKKRMEVVINKHYYANKH